MTTNETQPVNLAKINMREIGTTGLERYAGEIFEEPLRQLQGRRGRKIFREMAWNDDVVGAVLFAVEMLIRQVSWRWEAADNTNEAAQAADFMAEVIGDMSMTWEDTLAEILTMLPFGWSVLEIVYKLRDGQKPSPGESSDFDDGRIGWRKLPIRSQDSLERWHFDDTGGIDAVEFNDPATGVGRFTIPIEKALLFRVRAWRGSPEGLSILRNAWRSWWFKKRIQEIEAIGIERDLAGIPVGWVPAEWLGENATAEQSANLSTVKELVRNIRRDEQEGVVMPLAYDEQGNKRIDLELLNSGGSRQFETSETIQRYDRAIASSMLADFILIGHESVGSFALIADKSTMFSIALGAFMDAVAAIFNRHAVPRLWRLNGLPIETMPKLVHGQVERVDLKELGAYVSALAGAGAQLFPDERLEMHLRAAGGLPQPEQRDTEL